MRRARRAGFTRVTRATTKVRFGDLYHSLIRIRWPSFFALLVLWYFFINTLFATAYALSGPEGFDGMRFTTGGRYFLECFFFSVQTFATIGYGHVSPRGLMPNILVTLEAMSGLLSISVATGLLWGRFSKPTARIIFSDYAVVNMIDGVPSLMFRIANERQNLIAAAEVRATLLVIETTKEGETYRNFHDLALERSDTPLFALSWTVVHPIDAKSPLHGKGHKELEQLEALLLVSVSGVDDTIAQQIHARYSYSPGHILWNRRFVDVLLNQPDGQVKLDIDHFHDVVEL